MHVCHNSLVRYLNYTVTPKLTGSEVNNVTKTRTLVQTMVQDPPPRINQTKKKKNVLTFSKCPHSVRFITGPYKDRNTSTHTHTYTHTNNYVQTHPDHAQSLSLSLFSRTHLVLHPICWVGHVPRMSSAPQRLLIQCMVRQSFLWSFIYLTRSFSTNNIRASQHNRGTLCFCCEMFLSISWKVRTLYFSKYN